MLAAFVEDRSDIARAIAVSARYEDHADAEVLVTVASSPPGSDRPDRRTQRESAVGPDVRRA